MRVLRWFFFAIVGLFAALGALVAIAIVGMALLWNQFSAPSKPVPETAILQLDLRTPIVEADPFRFPFVGALETQLTLREIIEGLERAGSDERIKGVIARVGGTQLGLAQIEELRTAIARFRETGKPAIAFAETFGEAGNGTLDYYLASAFDEIWLQPSGDVGITGLRIEMPFMRTLLADLGIEAEFAAREDYKSAADMFTRDDMSTANRRNLEMLMRSWMTQIVGDIADAREINYAEVQDLIDRAPISAEEAESTGLIDGIGYLDAAEYSVRERGGHATLYEFADFAQQEAAPADGPVVALVYGVGPIHLGKGSSGFEVTDMGADTLVAALRRAQETKDVVAIVLRIDSPGGSYVASDAIWKEVWRTRESGIPIVVSMGNVAASGGYFIAAPATAIVADRATVTGSIGVLSGKFSLDRLWDDIGVSWDGIGFGAHSDMYSPHQPFTEAQRAKLEETLDRIYGDFLDRVADGRGLDRDAVQEAAQGQVWSGTDALTRGLVDELGGLRTAIAVALENAGYAREASYRLVTVTGDESQFGGIFGDIEAGVAAFRDFTRAMAKLSAFIDGNGAAGPTLLPAPPEPR